MNTWKNIQNSIITEWNERLCDMLIKRKYKWFWKTYKSYKYCIQKIDVIRYFILHCYGGLYVDTDLECFRDVFQFIQRPNKVYLVESANPTGLVRFSNLLMYSPKNHPFWTRVFYHLMKNELSIAKLLRHTEIMYSTGPGFIDEMYNLYNTRYGIKVFPSRLFNPLGIVRDDYIQSANVFTIHHGTGLWEDSDSKILVYLYNKHKILMLTLLSLFIWYSLI